MNACECCVNALPVDGHTPEGYRRCLLQVVWRYMSVCNIGRFSALPSGELK